MPFGVFSTPGKLLVIGHRGASGHAPENSLAAFRAAVTDGHPGRCDGVELDVHTTADGELVVHHDPTLVSGMVIASNTLDAVRSLPLPSGEPLPTLAEALEILQGISVFIEAKGLPPSADLTLLEQIRRHAHGSGQVHAFDHRIIARLRRLDQTTPLGLLSRSYPVDPVRQLHDAGADTLWQEADLIDEALIEACHRAGVRIIAWTVNDAAEAARLTELGVDGLCGNWPERLRASRHSE